MADVFKDWKDGDAPLRGRDVAGTLRWLREAILGFQTQGLVAEGIADLVVSDDERSFHLVTTTGRQLPEIDLPPAPWRWRLEGRVQGASYAEGDAFHVPSEGSSYLVLRDHNASADLETDLAAVPPRLALLAKGGTSGSDVEAVPGGKDIRVRHVGIIDNTASNIYLAFEAVARAGRIPARMAGSVVRSSAPPSGTMADFRVELNGTEIARCVIGPGEQAGTWMTFPQADVPVAAGDTLLFKRRTTGNALNDATFMASIVIAIE